MKRPLIFLLLVCALAIAGCGGGHKSSSSTSSASSSSTSSTSTSTPVGIPGPSQARPAPARHPSAQVVARRCPKGRAAMGCAVTAEPGLTRGRPLRIPGVPLFPDVYEGQGAVNWTAVAGWQRAHGWHPTAIFKVGEYRLDHQLARNASETRRLGYGRAGYWFVRNTGCAHEAAQMIAAGRAYGLHVLVEDDEVPEAAGYAACLTPRLHAAGFEVVEYTSPGVNPDRSNPGVKLLWIAAYGPQHVPCVFTCSVGQLDRQTIVAWQLTDGVHGFITNVPGLGRIDMSADYGIGRVLVPPAPPKPKPAPPPKPKPTVVLTSAERAAVARYDALQRSGASPAALEPTQARLAVLAHVVWVAAHRAPPSVPSWGYRHRGARFQVLWPRSLGRKVAR